MTTNRPEFDPLNPTPEEQADMDHDIIQRIRIGEPLYNFIPPDRNVLRRIVKMRAEFNPFVSLDPRPWDSIAAAIGAPEAKVEAWYWEGIAIIRAADAEDAAMTDTSPPAEATRQCWNCEEIGHPCYDGGMPWCVKCGVVDNPADRLGSRVDSIPDLSIAAARFRMQCRVDVCLERNGGDARAATTSAGIGISYRFAQDLVSALDHAQIEIGRLRAVVRKVGLSGEVFSHAEINAFLKEEFMTGENDA